MAILMNPFRADMYSLKDVIAAQKALDRYRDMHPAFERDREFTLLSVLNA